MFASQQTSYLGI